MTETDPPRRRFGLMQRIACAVGLHYWWHSQILVRQKAHDICMACGKTRPEKDET